MQTQPQRSGSLGGIFGSRRLLEVPVFTDVVEADGHPFGDP
ncbi:hypothetical protein PM8797T_05175 [Gimesia maris DSM 8797]|nr:hypothetical protein PM8797T_05175 [Gimesia maris DSM 8797]